MIPEYNDSVVSTGEYMRTIMTSLLLIMISCGTPPSTHSPTQSYSGQWLQLDQYFPESCFILDEDTKTVWVFDAGDEEQEHKDDWMWVFNQPDLYTFDDSIDLYVAEAENGCWRMSIWGVDVNACPCSYAIPQKPEEDEE